MLNRADIRETFLKNGVETIGSSPEQLMARIKSEVDKMGNVIKAAGIRDE